MGNSKTNRGLLSEKFSKMGSTAMAGSSAVDLGREALKRARERRAETVTSQPPVFSDADLKISQNNLARSISERIGGGESVARELLEKSTRSFLPSTQRADGIGANSVLRPELERVAVDVSKKKGVVDSFYTRVTFSFGRNELNSKTLKAIRIFRSEGSPVVPVPPLSLRGMELIKSDRSGSKLKNQDSVSALAVRLDENSVQNSLTRLIPMDPGSGTRVAVQPQKNQEQTTNSDSISAFKEIGFCSPDSLQGQGIGTRVEFFFDDPSISYGKTYSYYVVAVDSSMRESKRTRIVSVNALALRVPPMPKRISQTITNGAVSLSIISEDQLVEKFEVWRKELTEGPTRLISKESRVVSGRLGSNFDRETKKLLDNGSLLIGECVNSGPAGAMFYDRRVERGARYLYRIFSVDVFGNKSERPREVHVTVPDGSRQRNDIERPVLTTEVDPVNSGVKITIECDDENVVCFFLERKNVTIGQNSFTTPGQGSSLDLTPIRRVKGRDKLREPTVSNLDLTWNGRIERTSSIQNFVDRYVTRDHVYQYRVHGVDKFGNRSSYCLSKLITFDRRQMIQSPVNIQSFVLASENGVEGIRVQWQPGIVDVSAEDRLGNREDLRNSAVRTLYQVERRRIGEQVWRSFPLVENTMLFDAAKSQQLSGSQLFRPDLVEMGEEYMYRVTSVQEGGSVSQISDVTRVSVVLPVLSPSRFRVKSGDTRARPLYCTLSWNTSEGSAPVDTWEIERAVVNNVFAGRINVRNPGEVNSLPWEKFRTVYRESSRTRSESIDSIGLPLDTTIVGDHSFVDMDVSLGDSFFYRIRAVSVFGDSSDWRYSGMTMTDDVFERRLSNTLTQEKFEKLGSTNISFREVSDVEDRSVTQEKGYGIIPTYSLPSKSR